jgi:predicted HTH transcriptional regulator
VAARIVEEFGSRYDLPQQVSAGNQDTYEPPPDETEILRDLIVQGESSVVEFKSSLRWDFYREMRHDEIEQATIKTLAAFMNSQGGVLILGVDDEGKPVGLDKDYQTLRKKNRDGFELFLVGLVSLQLGKDVCRFIEPAFVKYDDCDVCRIQVEPSPFPVYAGDDAEFYIRTGNQSQRLNPKETVKYIRHQWS